MEANVAAAYCALMLGCVVRENADNRQNVLARLPERSFEPLVNVIGKSLCMVCVRRMRVCLCMLENANNRQIVARKIISLLCLCVHAPVHALVHVCVHVHVRVHVRVRLGFNVPPGQCDR